MKNNNKNAVIIILSAVLAAVVVAFAVVYFVVNPKGNTTISNSTGAPVLQETQNTDSQTANSTSTEQASGNISIETAKEIAMQKSDITEDSLVYISAHEERDRNTIYYDVELSDSSFEYEYEIDLNGNIISSKKEPYKSKANSSIATSVNSDYIGVEKAKSIAFADCGISASDVAYIKDSLERDNGTYVYEIEFKTSAKKYEYEIDAFSGKILEQSAKPIKGAK